MTLIFYFFPSTPFVFNFCTSCFHIISLSASPYLSPREQSAADKDSELKNCEYEKKASSISLCKYPPISDMQQCHCSWHRIYPQSDTQKLAFTEGGSLLFHEMKIKMCCADGCHNHTHRCSIDESKCVFTTYIKVPIQMYTTNHSHPARNIYIPYKYKVSTHKDPNRHLIEPS